jgi:hypothetical protein
VKSIHFRIHAHVHPTGEQAISYVIFSRKRARRYGLTLILSGDPQHDRMMVRDVLRRLRKGWRDEVLGDGWQGRSAMRRRALQEAEFRAKYPMLEAR